MTKKAKYTKKQVIAYLKKNMTFIFNGILIFILWIDLWYILTKYLDYIDKKIGSFSHVIVLSVCMFLLYIQNFDFQFIYDAGL